MKLFMKLIWIIENFAPIDAFTKRASDIRILNGTVCTYRGTYNWDLLETSTTWYGTKDKTSPQKLFQKAFVFTPNMNHIFNMSWIIFYVETNAKLQATLSHKQDKSIPLPN